jgi:hypothetical protein
LDEIAIAVSGNETRASRRLSCARDRCFVFQPVLLAPRLILCLEYFHALKDDAGDGVKVDDASLNGAADKGDDLSGSSRLKFGGIFSSGAP